MTSEHIKERNIHSAFVVYDFTSKQNMYELVIARLNSIDASYSIISKNGFSPVLLLSKPNHYAGAEGGNKCIYHLHITMYFRKINSEQKSAWLVSALNLRRNTVKVIIINDVVDFNHYVKIERELSFWTNRESLAYIEFVQFIDIRKKEELQWMRNAAAELIYNFVENRKSRFSFALKQMDLTKTTIESWVATGFGILEETYRQMAKISNLFQTREKYQQHVVGFKKTLIFDVMIDIRKRVEQDVKHDFSRQWWKNQKTFSP